MRGFLRLLVSGSTLAATCIALGGPSGLYLIPIADVQQPGFGFSYCGFEGAARTRYSYFSAQEFGITNRLEAGWDSDFQGNTYFNAKFQVVSSARFSASLGAENVCGSYSEPFVVGSYDAARFRIHGGYWKAGSTILPFIGADFPISADWSGSVEHLGGRSGVSWLSAFYTVPHGSGIGIDFALGIPVDRGRLQHSVSLYYSFGR